MRIGSLFGWGIIVYAVISLAWQGLVLYGLAGSVLSRIATLFVLVAVTTVAARSLRFHSWKDVLPYAIAWAVMMGVLDAIFSVPYAGWTMFADWNVWVGYALVALVPLITFRLRPAREAPLVS